MSNSIRFKPTIHFAIYVARHTLCSPLSSTSIIVPHFTTGILVILLTLQRVRHACKPAKNWGPADEVLSKADITSPLNFAKQAEYELNEMNSSDNKAMEQYRNKLNTEHEVTIPFRSIEGYNDSDDEKNSPPARH